MFAGREIALAAIEAGAQVTTFNRGLSGRDVDGVAVVRGDRNEPSDLARLAAAGPWDSVIDTSAYVPRETLAVAETLRPVARHYVLLSTVSVYARWPIDPLDESSEVLVCPPDAGPDYGVDVEDGPTKYGYQKAGCESAVQVAFGRDSTVLRPGVVLGPREYVGRLPWWLQRVSRGGRIVAPGEPQRSIQPVDVRDLAAFSVQCALERHGGAYNVTAPIGRETFHGMLEACAEATEASAEFVWIPDRDLLAHGVRQWSELPLWRTFAGVWAVDSTRAHNAGLSSRRLRETVRDTWGWMTREGWAPHHERANEIGLSTEREQAILADVS